MDVLIVEPEKAPRMANIAGDLNSLQQVVGGYIEAVYPYDDPVAIVCNEEGKLIGLPLNRKLEDYDIIAGTFVVCGICNPVSACQKNTFIITIYFKKDFKKLCRICWINQF